MSSRLHALLVARIQQAIKFASDLFPEVATSDLPADLAPTPRHGIDLEQHVLGEVCDLAWAEELRANDLVLALEGRHPQFCEDVKHLEHLGARVLLFARMLEHGAAYAIGPEPIRILDERADRVARALSGYRKLYMESDADNEGGDLKRFEALARFTLERFARLRSQLPQCPLTSAWPLGGLAREDEFAFLRPLWTAARPVDDNEPPEPDSGRKPDVAEARESTSRPNWELYERLIARQFMFNLPPDLCVTTNAKVLGRKSGTPRQVDVLIESRHETGSRRRVIIDAKRHGRKIDVKQVEEFEGLMKDIGATHGYLVSPSGQSDAAMRRAEKLITISIVPLERVALIDPSKWPRCLAQKCSDGRVFWDGYPELTLALRRQDDGAVMHAPRVHCVGKCDRCGRFHVRCVTCSDLFSLDDKGDDQRCRCNTPWTWRTTIEHDRNGDTSAALHVAMATGKTIIVTRRPLAARRRKVTPRPPSRARRNPS